MALTSDAKFVISILVATVLVIGGGAYITSKKSSSTAEKIVPDSLAERLVREDSPVTGPADAKVTVVEFGDFQCPACGSVHPLLKEVKEKYKDSSVRFVFRHFPLSQHEHAFLASEASIEAASQGKFWEYHDTLFENQINLTQADLENYAKQLSLDENTFKEALSSSKHEDAVQRDITDGNALGVSGTPTIFINKSQYVDRYSVDSISAAIEAELAK